MLRRAGTGLTGLEPATSALTGRCSNPLNYNPSSCSLYTRCLKVKLYRPICGEISPISPESHSIHIINMNFEGGGKKTTNCLDFTGYFRIKLFATQLCNMRCFWPIVGTRQILVTKLISRLISISSLPNGRGKQKNLNSFSSDNNKQSSIFENSSRDILCN